MNPYIKLFNMMKNSPFEGWVDELGKLTQSRLVPASHGDILRWEKALRQLPCVERVLPNVKNGCILFELSETIETKQVSHIEKVLQEFHPWRKGPYTIHGVHIDTEWRSDLKWDRLSGSIQPLKDRVVLDIGCGSGYHCFRMALDGAKLVLGIEPYILSVMQFQAVNHFSKELPVFVVPVGIDEVPDALHAFDTVFSMGLLYHRRDPLEHLKKIKECLSAGGELVLETLVIESDKEKVLIPKGRYAKMRNVWNIPSPKTIEMWLKQCGYSNIQCIDVTKTTIHEQRSTDWMRYESLSDYLDINDSAKTIEGWPAPVRAVFTAMAE